MQGVAGQHQRREGQGDVGAHAAAVAQCAHGGTTREASTGRLGDMGHANCWEATEKRKGRAWIQEEEQPPPRRFARCSAHNVSATPH